MRFSTSYDCGQRQCSPSWTARRARVAQSEQQPLSMLWRSPGRSFERARRLGRACRQRGGGDPRAGSIFRSPRTPAALLLAHFDTVWPLGTLERMPVREDEATALRARRLRHEGQPGDAFGGRGGPGPAGTGLPRPVWCFSPPTRRSAARPRGSSIEELARQSELRPGARASPGRRRL